MDLDEDRQVTDRSEIYMGEDLPQAKNIQEYFYTMQKVMDDFDEDMINKKNRKFKAILCMESEKMESKV